jgi:hypothetical protein
MSPQLYIDPENRISRVPFIVPTSHVHYVALDEYNMLKAEYERLRASSFVTAVPVNEYEKLKNEVERLRKAVMHSPAAQLKLKELEGKTTYEEINAAKDGKPSE